VSTLFSVVLPLTFLLPICCAGGDG
jgi:hypothetical protein